MGEVIGAVVIARHGDRTHYYQDPITYAGSACQSTPLGAVSIFSPNVLSIVELALRSNPINLGPSSGTPTLTLHPLLISKGFRLRL